MHRYQSIPLSKIEDFGVHANQYYSLEVQIFKSSLDTELLGLLWNKYWINQLIQSPLISIQNLYLFSTSERELKASFRIGSIPPLSSPTCIKSYEGSN